MLRTTIVIVVFRAAVRAPQIAVCGIAAIGLRADFGVMWTATIIAAFFGIDALHYALRWNTVITPHLLAAIEGTVVDLPLPLAITKDRSAVMLF